MGQSVSYIVNNERIMYFENDFIFWGAWRLSRIHGVHGLLFLILEHKVLFPGFQITRFLGVHLIRSESVLKKLVKSLGLSCFFICRFLSAMQNSKETTKKCITKERELILERNLFFI